MGSTQAVRTSLILLSLSWLTNSLRDGLLTQGTVWVLSLSPWDGDEGDTCGNREEIESFVRLTRALALSAEVGVSGCCPLLHRGHVKSEPELN